MTNSTMKKNQTNSFTYTENGAICLSSTGNRLVDLFGTIGALRNAEDNRKLKLFEDAVQENKELAAKILFYGRDIREGLGERDTFRTMLAYAADNHKEIVAPNIPLIGFYGRFDDLYCLDGTKCEDEMWSFMKEQFEKDLANMKAGKPVSLLAKWIKTPDASSENTKKLGIKTSQKLGYKKVGDFKKDLRALRKYLDIVEIKVSANDFSTIAYDKVPSNAMAKYRKLFGLKDTDRFTKYIDDVKSGKTEIKSNTLYPYDLVKPILNEIRSYYCRSRVKMNKTELDVIEAQWKALPNYIENGDNILIMSDVSGSMFCCDNLPISTSIGLGMYFAERANGPFKDMFMTFDSTPKLVKVHGKDIYDKVNNMARAPWGGSTNLEAAFEVILKTAVDNKLDASQMPKALVIISDMQIDSALHGTGTFYDMFEKRFAQAGYTMPNVIFWNVNSERDGFHAESAQRGVQYLSGHSVNTFKSLINCLNMTPVEAMMKVICSDRYAPVTVA